MVDGLACFPLPPPKDARYICLMPYEWTASRTDGARRWTLTAWPHRSLPPQGFATFIGVTAVLMLVPLLAVLGTVLLWGLLPFVVATIWLIWHFLRRSYADGALCEVLDLTSDHIELTRTNPRGPEQHWQANPYWVRADIHAAGGPVPHYLVLTGAGRTVELGAFLAPEERVALFAELSDRLRGMDINAG